MATERIDIIIREDGSRVVRRSIEEVGSAADRAARGGLALLKSALGGLGVALVVSQLRSLSDEYTQIQNRLKLTTTDQANLNAVFQDLQRISAETGSSLKANAELYSRVSISAKDLGVSQAEVLSFTEKLNKAIKISGATAVEAENGLIQLSQGLASGTLRGDELRAVLEQLPAVADIIAQGLGVTRGELRQLGAEGKITAAQVLEAFRKVGPELDENFNKTVKTSAEAFVVLRNQLVETTGKLFEITGTSEGFTNAILSLANYVKDATPAILDMGRAIAGTLDPTDQLSDGMKVFTTILVVTIGVLKLIAIVIKTVVFGAFSALGNLIGGLAVSLGKFGEGLVETFQAVGGVLGGIGRALVQAAKGDFSAAGETLSAAFTNPFEEAGKRFSEADGIFINAFKDSGQILADNFAKGDAALVDSASFTIEKLVKIFDDGARQVQDRKKEIVGGINTDAGPAKPLPASAQEQRAIEKLQNQLRGLLNEIDPLSGAVLEFEKAQRILNAAAEKGLITTQQQTEYLAALEKKYRDIFDPLGKVNRQLDEQAGLLGLASREREVEAQVLDITKQLLEDGVTLNERETRALRDKITAFNELNRVTQLQDQILESSVGAREGFIQQVQAIQNLLDDPTTGFGQTDAFNAATQGNSDLFAGSQEAVDAQIQRFMDMYEQINILRQADIISEQTAAQARARVAVEQNQLRLQNAQTFFGALATLSRSENSKLAKIGQAAAIAQATIDGVLAVQKALASAPPPANYALAAAAGVAAAANVAQIAGVSTGFATGGEFTVGGSGGVDSQMVAFRATPGEKVAVSTQNQLRKGAPNGQTAQQAPAQAGPAVSIINVRDPKEIPNAIQSQDGREAIINVISDNASLFKQILSNN